MENNAIFNQAAKFLRERRDSRRWKAVVLCLAIMVICGTAWLLSNKGQALTHPGDVLDCQVMVHEHSADCLDGNGNLVCGKADYVFHVHNDDCYDADGELACQLPEVEVHEHTADCFATEKILLCGYEESEKPSFDGEMPTVDVQEDSPDEEAATVTAEEQEPLAASQSMGSSEKELICGQEEHIHDDSCYGGAERELICNREEQEGHKHADSCYTETAKTELICGREEQEGHKHDSSCYTAEKSLACTNEEEGHEHDDSCYATEEKLTCGQEEEEGHKHDDGCCTETTEKELTCGLAEEEGHSHAEDCYEAVEGMTLVCGKEEHKHSDACYSVKESDSREDGTEEDNFQEEDREDESVEEETHEDEIKENEGHKHTDECYETVRKLTCGKKGVHIHDDDCYDGDVLICEVPCVESVEEHVHDTECFKEGEVEEYTTTFRNDKIEVTAVYKKSSGIPEAARLNVEQITKESDAQYYEKRLSALKDSKDALGNEVTLAMLLRIGFCTDDERFTPEDTVRFTVHFLDDSIYAAGDTVKVACFDGDDARIISETDLDDGCSITFEDEKLSELALLTPGEEDSGRILSYEGGDYIVTVGLEESTKIPADAQLMVEQITAESDSEHYRQRLAELRDTAGMLEETESIALLLHMWISMDGKEIALDEAADVTVQFLGNELYFEGDAVKAAHFTGTTVGVLSAADIDGENSTTFEVDALDEFAFITEDVRVMTYVGEEFIVTVRFHETAQIPADAKLAARRITDESDPEQFAAREEQLQEAIEDEIIALGALFDIGFYDADGNEVEPKDTVDVKIRLLDRDAIEKPESAKVAHFVEDEETTEENVEIIEDAGLIKDEEGGLSTSFQAESFSTYAITVDGQVNSASTLRKAFALAQQGNGGTVTLEGDIVFTNNKDEDDDPKGGAIPINQGKTVTLDLNGYTITVDSSNNNVSLFDIEGNLYIKDSPREGVTRSVTKNAEEAKAPTFTYDNSNNLHHLEAMTCSVTESQVIDSSRGVTQETTYTYTVTGQGAIVGTNKNGTKNESPLLYVKAGTLVISDGAIVGDTGNRAVEMRYGSGWQVGLTATMTLDKCYLVGCIAISKLDGGEISGGAVYCGDSGTIHINEGAIISGNTARRGGGIYVISSDGGDSLVNITGGYITNNMATFNDSGRNYGDGGGGIDVNNAAIEMTGGYITGNKTYAGGAGIALSGRKQWRATKIINGTIASNYCVGYHGEGGGIALYDESIIEINGKDAAGKDLGKVYITNNEVGGVADWGGGGLFVGRDSSATLFDALITGNSADGFGGGLGGCSTGRIVEVNSSTRGAAIFDNSAAGHQYAGDSTKNEDHEYSHNTPTFWERDDRGRYYFQDLFSVLFTTVDNTMLGGGSEHWDGTVDGVRVNVNVGQNVWQSSYLSGLTAFPDDTDKTLAENLAAVYINGNYSAVHGGGIMCNGIMVIGENKGQIEIITAMELTGTKKLIDGDGANIPLTNNQAGQFSFSVYAGAAYLGSHTHKDECHVDNDNTKALICGLEEGEPVFEQHEHIPPTDKYGNENPNSCYRKLTDTAGGKEWELTCGKGVVVKGTNGTEVITGNDPDTGNVTTTAYDPQTISFDALLTFDLQRELGKEKEDINVGDQYEYWYYIKEDDATEASANAEIERDRTVYCMVVTVQKKDYGLIGLSNIRKYYDDIVGVRVYKTIKGADGKWSWDDAPVYTKGLMHNQYHAIKINMDDFSTNKTAFTNKKTDVKRIEVRKSWDYDYSLDKPEWNKEDEIEWVSVALFTKGGYGYNEVAYGSDDKDENGNSLEGQTKPWENEIEEWVGAKLGRLYLSKSNNWTASWDNLPDDFPIDKVEVREIDIKYTDVKWEHWYMEKEDIDKLNLTLADRIDPASWAFTPKYTYTSEGDVAKVVALNIPKTFGISFTKIGYNGADGKPVGNGKDGAVYGAKFEVYDWVGDDEKGYWAEEPMLFEQVNDGYAYIDKGVVTDRRTVTQLVTNVYGKINISNLWYSKFLIREVGAPVGYKPVHDHLIDYGGTTATAKVICILPDGMQKRNGDTYNGEVYHCEVFPKLYENQSEFINTPEDRGSDYFDYDKVNDVLIFKMIDPEDKYELPKTGGTGTDKTNILGTSVMLGMIALIYAAYRRRKGAVGG